MALEYVFPSLANSMSISSVYSCTRVLGRLDKLDTMEPHVRQ